MQQYATLQPNSRVTPNVNQAELNADTVFIGSSILIAPLLISTGVILYRKYRSTVLRRRITALEKIWRLELYRDV